MKLSTLLVLALTALFSASAAHAVETSTPEERTLELFQHYLKAKDWQMAEVVARGAVAKFGPDGVLIVKMRSNVETAVEGNLTLLKRFYFMPMPKIAAPRRSAERRYACVYNVQDLLTSADGRLVDNSGKRLHDLAKEVKQECFANIDASEFEVAPFDTNLSLVISATQKPHLKVLEFLIAKRAKAVQPQ
ncbi:hypothetical protein LOC68_26290 [Blastopirellula sp. JC732]|uniref:DUF4154 domain-containing protein n=1 Tax=Blastopirellula sediminis TaxID=2894196 RepID=A0A9X1MSY6_9BACT|nr:hypothetical protein [Blastopirellula sediminis]MCC9604781.1 hypothetical protein [Blastopirellula sediminis]MCC9631920.1 hypothetical protein [Blastopirellula sediminis]